MRLWSCALERVSKETICEMMLSLSIPLAIPATLNPDMVSLPSVGCGALAALIFRAHVLWAVVLSL
jgi:hypothetical protein